MRDALMVVAIVGLAAIVAVLAFAVIKYGESIDHEIESRERSEDAL